MTCYYNENDPYPAQWLRNLIEAGHITAGDVDERSIVDVQPSDLDGYERCHFFAGIAGWDLALQMAGWEGPVWTGSCPCQPFSAAGARRGTDDPRHLWPEWFRLIQECRPPTIFGEQVASKDGRAWLAAVRADLENMGYAVGGADLCAAGIGAPHIRQRLWFVAHDSGARRDATGRTGGADDERRRIAEVGRSSGTGNVAHAEGQRSQGRGDRRSGIDTQGGRLLSRGPSEPSELAHTEDTERRALDVPPKNGCDRQDARRSEAHGKPRARRKVCGWDDIEWLPCTDGKARPTQPGLFPLAHGVPGRMGRLRAYGNAIVPQVAAGFIKAAAESIVELTT